MKQVWRRTLDVVLVLADESGWERRGGRGKLSTVAPTRSIPYGIAKFEQRPPSLALRGPHGKTTEKAGTIMRVEA